MLMLSKTVCVCVCVCVCVRWCSPTHFKKQQSDHSGEHHLATKALSSTFRYSTKSTTPSRLGSQKPWPLVSLQNFLFFVQNTQREKKRILWNGERRENDACQQEQKLLSACVCASNGQWRERAREYPKTTGHQRVTLNGQWRWTKENECSFLQRTCTLSSIERTRRQLSLIAITTATVCRVM